MEEDIKILEEFINNYKMVQEKYKDDEIQAEIERSCYFEEVPAQAIQNLLKAYKQDEEVIDEMAYVMSKTIRISGVRQHKKIFKEYFRKKVTNE